MGTDAGKVIFGGNGRGIVEGNAEADGQMMGMDRVWISDGRNKMKWRKDGTEDNVGRRRRVLVL